MKDLKHYNQLSVFIDESIDAEGVITSARARRGKVRREGGEDLALDTHSSSSSLPMTDPA